MSTRQSDIKRFGREFADRLAEWDNDGAELTDAEAKRYLDGENPDLLLVSRFISGVLSAEDAADTELRFIHDPAFFAEYWPMIVANRAARRVFGRVEAELESRAVRAAHRGRRRFRVGAAAFLFIMIGMLWRGVATARVERRERAQGRASTTAFWFSSQTESGVQRKVLNLGQVLIKLDPHSRLTRGMSLLPHNGSGFMSLDGRADFVLGGAMVTVNTSVMLATIRLDGEYQITSVPGAGESQLDVLRGDATVELAEPGRLTLRPQRVDLAAGQRAVVKRNGSIVITKIVTNRATNIVTKGTTSTPTRGDTPANTTNSTSTTTRAIPTIPSNPTRRTGGVP